MRIVPWEHDPAKRELIPELSDIWPRLQQVVLHQHAINCVETRFRAQQIEMLRARRLELPSLFHNGTDISVQSYYCYQRFFYRFAGPEEYFWATTLPEQLLAGIIFPARGLALSLYLLREPRRARARRVRAAARGGAEADMRRRFGR